MDVTWRFICVLNGKDPEKHHQRLRERVEKNTTEFPTLHPAVMERQSWFLDLIALRNAIAHEGALDDFAGFGYQGNDLRNPLIREVSARHFGIQLWGDVRAVIEELITAALTDASSALPNTAATQTTN